MIQFYIWYSYQISFHQSLLKRPAKWKSLKDEQERLGMPSDFQKAFFFQRIKILESQWIASQGLQNLDLCLVPMAFNDGGIFILLWCKY